MDRERLTILADFLDTVPKEKFDLYYWWFHRNEPCNSTGCAVGWATTIPEFANDGLGLNALDDTYSYIRRPFYGITIAWDSVKAFFDISFPQAMHLFSVYEYKLEQRTAQHVAARIRKFMNNEEI